MGYIRFYLAFIVIAAVFFLSCKETPTSSGTPGDIIGNIKLYDTNYVLMTDNSGVKVSIDGTSYSALSDASGKWQLTNIPPGTYTLVFSKSGYGDQKDYNVVFSGNGTLYYSLLPSIGNIVRTMYLIPNLYPSIVLRPFEDIVELLNGRDTTSIDTAGKAHTIVRYDTLIIKNAYSTFSSRSSYLYHGQTVGTVFFFSHTQNIDPENSSTFQYSQSQDNYSSDTSGMHNVQILRSSLLSAGFAENETVYCCAFAGTEYCSMNQWTDPKSNQYVYTGFSPYHSEVESFVLP